MKKFVKLLVAFCVIGSFLVWKTPLISVVQADQTDPTQSDLQKINFDNLDPLKIGGSEDILKQKTPAKDLSTPGKILSELLKYVFPAAGLILFLMLIWGGFEILAGAATAKSKDAGRQRITAALIGFVLLFASYWITQIIQIIFGVQILGV